MERNSNLVLHTWWAAVHSIDCGASVLFFIRFKLKNDRIMNSCLNCRPGQDWNQTIETKTSIGDQDQCWRSRLVFEIKTGLEIKTRVGDQDKYWRSRLVLEIKTSVWDQDRCWRLRPGLEIKTRVWNQDQVWRSRPGLKIKTRVEDRDQGWRSRPGLTRDQDQCKRSRPGLGIKTKVGDQDKCWRPRPVLETKTSVRDQDQGWGSRPDKCLGSETKINGQRLCTSPMVENRPVFQIETKISRWRSESVVGDWGQE